MRRRVDVGTKPHLRCIGSRQRSGLPRSSPTQNAVEVIPRAEDLGRVEPLLNGDRPYGPSAQIENGCHAVRKKQFTHVPVVMNVGIDESRENELAAGFDDLGSRRKRWCPGISGPDPGDPSVGNENSGIGGWSASRSINQSSTSNQQAGAVRLRQSRGSEDQQAE